MTAQPLTLEPAASEHEAGHPAGSLPVVYVAGSGHTGSTLLAMLLDEHPEIVSVGETAVKPKIRRRGEAALQTCSCGAPVADCPFWRRIFAGVQAQGYDFGPNRWTNDYRSEHPLVHRLLTRESSYAAVRALQRWSAQYLPVHAARLKLADAVNVAFIRAAFDVSGATVFCDTTKNVLRLTRLLALPALDVKVITLVRDVRGYAASARRRGHRLEDAARTWRNDQEMLALLTSTLPADRTCRVRYEDLCGNPEGTLRRLYGFCDVAAFPPVTSVASSEHHVLGNSMRLHGRIQVRMDETWRSRLTADEQQRILAIAGDMNRTLGYL